MALALPTLAALLLPLLAACAPSPRCASIAMTLAAPRVTAHNGVLYSVAQHLDAWDVATGTLFWQAQLAPRPGAEFSAPAVVGGVLYVVSGDGGLQAWRAATGAALWQTRPLPRHEPASDAAVPAPVVVGGVVYAGLNDGAIAAWRARDGSLLWQSPAPVAAQGVAATTPASVPAPVPVPVVVGGAVYAATANLVMALRGRDGRQVWQARTPLASQRFANPVVVGGVLYAGASNNVVYAFAAESGAPLWQSRPVGILSATRGTARAPEVLVAGARIYLSTADGWMAALRATDGVSLWQTQIPGVGAYRPAQLAGTLLYTASAAGVYAVNSANGQFDWQAGAHLGDHESMLIVADETVYVSGQDQLFAWRARDGVFLWQIERANASPLGASEGLVYLGMSGTTATCRRAGSASGVVVLWSGDGSVLWHGSE